MESSLRVCSDCRTTDTPLWRSGPDGPMSLCNACGIRYRKRKRRDGMEEEAKKGSAMSGNKDRFSSSIAKGQREKKVKVAMALGEEELRRRQREKQEKILRVLLRQRRELWSWRLRLSPAGYFGGGESEEVAEAALLLLSLSSAIYVHS